MEPVTINMLAAATNGRASGIADLDTEIRRVAIDSRKIRRRDAFWALPGPRFDGHDFVQDAREQGAVVCVVESGRKLPAGIPSVVVENTRAALQQFAAWYRTRLDTMVIAVTGSVGKTTTRHMVHATLSKSFRGAESPENYNNEIGVPLSLLCLESKHEFGVLEIGASHVGEVAQLASLAQPEVGIVTAVSPAHLEGFGSIENIARAKRELIEAVADTGFAVINGDDERVLGMADGAPCRIVTVGERVHNELVARRIEVANDGLRFQVDRSRFQVPVPGRHHLTSAIIAVAIGREIGMSDDDIAAGLRSFRPVAGRCQPLKVGPWTVIDDSYNASPRSMLAACDLLRAWHGNANRILVAGDMLELGATAEQFHAELGQTIAAARISRLAALGRHASDVAQNARDAGMDAGCIAACQDLETLIVLLDCWLEPGDVVLVKGSRALHMEQVVERLRDLAATQRRRRQQLGRAA